MATKAFKGPARAVAVLHGEHVVTKCLVILAVVVCPASASESLQELQPEVQWTTAIRDNLLK
eukprot:CAMPEP_0172898558 /NCGR_PEP_ID=MMETSP1075-20121228/159943_1 /TAXON_ID=2916 /ORGANISM="Ceratium fusus, Strain PA161109" /LENGTH=61 /DNA_ID=CAMNT_0013754373 /DNA_START=26 /DNA_END=208 /DNA_ORIENTATION=+